MKKEVILKLLENHIFTKPIWERMSVGKYINGLLNCVKIIKSVTKLAYKWLAKSKLRSGATSTQAGTDLSDEARNAIDLKKKATDFLLRESQ